MKKERGIKCAVEFPTNDKRKEIFYAYAQANEWKVLHLYRNISNK